MRLIILPALASPTNGYGIAVQQDLKRLNMRESDIRIWYVKKETWIDNGDYLIKRFPRFCLRRIYNLCVGLTTTDILPNDIKKLRINLNDVDEIFCGDVMFYRALRKLFPDKKITVRFHNCYARIYDRVRLFNLEKGLSFLYRLNLHTFYKLEKEIFNDGNTFKVFISEEDRDYYANNKGCSDDTLVWGFTPSMAKIQLNRQPPISRNKIIWYGGLDSHKVDSVEWFISEVYSKLIDIYPQLEFHLFGKGSEKYDEPSKMVYGHGFYSGADMPFKEESLFINPDLTGGGVKIKLLSYFENGVVFLTTPYGYEGYPKEYIDNAFCYVKEPGKWVSFLKEYFSQENLA